MLYFACRDAVVLRTLRHTLPNVHVLEAAMARAIAEMSPANNDPRQGLTNALQTLDAEISNLTAAIALGGNIPALVEELKAREQRRKTLQRATSRGHTPATKLTNRGAIGADLRARIAECGTKLAVDSSEGRAMLRLLIVGRLELKPTAQGYRFSGKGTLQPLLFHLKWRPHRDSTGCISKDRWRDKEGSADRYFVLAFAPEAWVFFGPLVGPALFCRFIPPVCWLPDDPPSFDFLAMVKTSVSVRADETRRSRIRPERFAHERHPSRRLGADVLVDAERPLREVFD